MGDKPEERAGYRISLSNFKRFSTPLSLAQIQSHKAELITLINQMHASSIGCSLYFPFEVSMRPVRPLQGYAFKLPKAFIEIFDELSQCTNVFTPHTEDMKLQATDFEVGRQYSRKEVCDWIGVLPEGAWATGYASHDNDWFIFANIGVAGRTGHDYPNQFDADGNLDWYAKGPARYHHPSTQALLSKMARVFIFYRYQDRDPWTFGGIGRPLDVTQGPPVKVKWSLRDPKETVISLPEEIPEDEASTIPEGAKKTIQVNIYERDREAREKCLRYWGTICQVCAFDFTKTYGDLGKGYIHVHHTKPLGEMKGQYDLDPITDLRPVCPNCHAMLHRVRPALSIEELRSRLQT
jgi:5-methylcytosine-specific restriction protein A